MKVTMEVQGLDRLRATGKGFSKQLDQQLRPAVKYTALEVRERAKNKARAFSIGGFYPASIRHTMKGGGLSAEVASIAKTARSIEEGRKPGEIVRFGLVLRWVQQRGVVRGVSIATRRAVRLTKKGRAAAKPDEMRVVREIVSAIKAHGTKPHPHLIPAAQEARSGWRRRVNDATKRALLTVRGV
jgi:hypothetical protein